MGVKLVQQNKFPSKSLVGRVLEVLSQERKLSYALLSPELKITEASENIEDFQPSIKGEIIGSNICDLFIELIGSESGLEEILRGESRIFKLDNINRESANGSIIYFSITISSINHEHPEQGLLLIVENSSLSSTLEQHMVQDRNELRLTKDSLSNANEELIKLNRLKSLFLSIAAHDLRSPLTAIRGYTDLAAGALEQDSILQVPEYLSVVRSQVETMTRLVSDFLDMDVIEQGKLKIHPVACVLNPIVEEVSSVMQEVASRKNVSIDTELFDLLPNVLGDPGRIRQILYNLITNAIKYTEEGDNIVVKTDSESNYGIIRVSDHGPGISQEDIKKLFVLYHRTEDARQSKTQGLGLGLFIVKSLVDLHQGKILVDSTLGEGTTFTVCFPLFEN